MLSQWEKMTISANILYKYKRDKLARRVRKGVPEALRVRVWTYFLQTDEMRELYGVQPSAQSLKQTLPAIGKCDIVYIVCSI